jgi:recombination protein RecA
MKMAKKAAKVKESTEDETLLEGEEQEGKSKNSIVAEMAIKSLRKKFGNDVLSWMDKKQCAERVIIPTGSLRLDSALGIGGILLGRMYEIFGSPMSGKSTLCLSIIKEAIQLGHKVIYVDAEQALDNSEHGLLVQMGIDVSKIALVQGWTAEANLDMAEALIATGEFALCVVDSISALLPAAESKLESFEDNTMMIHPKLMSRMCREFTPLCARTGTGLLLINQIRMSAASYGNPEVTSGGKSIPHYSSVRIKVSGGGVKSRLIMNSKGQAVGQKVTFEVVKNKMAPPFRSTEAELTYGKGFSRNGDLFDLAVEMGFIDRAGSWFSYGETKLGQGKDKALVALLEDKVMFKEVEKEVLSLLMGTSA